MQRSFRRLASRIAKRVRARRGSPSVSSRALFVGEPAALGVTEPAGLVKTERLEEALARLDHEEIPVVLCDEDVAADWKSAVRLLARAACRPSVVVLSAGNPLQLWPQVTAAGGYDIVRKPALPGMLDHVIRSATVYWRCRRALDAARREPGR
jgi:DNA-binding NarL/FixJ family response regulator